MTHHSCLQSFISDMNEFSVIWLFDRLISHWSFKFMTLYIMSSWFLTLLSFAFLTAWIIFWAKDRDSRRLKASRRVYFSFSIESIIMFDDWLNCLISSWVHSSRLSSFSYFMIRFLISSSVYHHFKTSSYKLSHRLIHINSYVLRINNFFYFFIKCMQPMTMTLSRRCIYAKLHVTWPKSLLYIFSLINHIDSLRIQALSFNPRHCTLVFLCPFAFFAFYSSVPNSHFLVAIRVFFKYSSVAILSILVMNNVNIVSVFLSWAFSLSFICSAL